MHRIVALTGRLLPRVRALATARLRLHDGCNTPSKPDTLDFEHFLRQQRNPKAKIVVPAEEPVAPYLTHVHLSGAGRSVFIEVYGCQMNVSDTEVAWAILERAGYTRSSDPNTVR